MKILKDRGIIDRMISSHKIALHSVHNIDGDTKWRPPKYVVMAGVTQMFNETLSTHKEIEKKYVELEISFEKVIEEIVKIMMEV
jgi:hypothetical protein